MLRRCIISTLALAVAGACAGGGSRSPRTATSTLRASLPPHRIVVIGDRFTDQVSFKAKVDQLVGSVFTQDKVFQAHARAFEIKEAPLAAAALARGEGGSWLDIRYNGTLAECYFTDGAETTTRLLDAARPFTPYHTVVVIANVAHKAGCAKDHRIYLGSHQTWTTTAHELGHRLGLHDEWAEADAAQPEFDRDDWAPASNCSACAERPWWRKHVAADAAPTEGCAMRSQGLWHFQPLCRMSRATGAPFCPACVALLTRRLTHEEELRPSCDPQGGPRPETTSTRRGDATVQPMTGGAQDYTQLVVTVRQNGGMRIERSADLRGVVRPEVVTSPHVYAIKLRDGEDWRYGESLPGDIFTQRAYGPASQSEGHGVVNAAASLVTMRVAGVKTEELRRAPNLQIEVFRVLRPSVVLNDQDLTRDSRSGIASRIDDWVATKTVAAVARGTGLQSQIQIK